MSPLKRPFQLNGPHKESGARVQLEHQKCVPPSISGVPSIDRFAQSPNRVSPRFETGPFRNFGFCLSVPRDIMTMERIRRSVVQMWRNRVPGYEMYRPPSRISCERCAVLGLLIFGLGERRESCFCGRNEGEVVAVGGCVGFGRMFWLGLGMVGKCSR